MYVNYDHFTPAANEIKTFLGLKDYIRAIAENIYKSGLQEKYV